MSTLEQRRAAPRHRTWALFSQSATAEDKEGATGAILDARLFEQELHRQRAQADRTDGSFVLLSFSVGSPATNGRTPQGYAGVLAEVVRKRVRLSDVVGWDGEESKRVGAILPCANPDALQGFVADIEKTFVEKAARPGTSAPELLCDVFSYPSNGTIEGLSM